jgi:hypothetical protein
MQTLLQRIGRDDTTVDRGIAIRWTDPDSKRMTGWLTFKAKRPSASHSAGQLPRRIVRGEVKCGRAIPIRGWRWFLKLSTELPSYRQDGKLPKSFQERPDADPRSRSSVIRRNTGRDQRTTVLPERTVHPNIVSCPSVFPTATFTEAPSPYSLSSSSSLGRHCNPRSLN